MVPRRSDGDSLPASLGPLDGSVVVLVVVLVASFFPPLLFDAWTPRIAVVVAALPIGAVVFAQLALNRDASARWIALAVGWTVIAGAVSGEARSALAGFAGRDLSALVVLGAAALWAVARQTSASGRRWLPIAVVGSATAAAVVGLLQVVADADGGPLALASGRPASVLTNPVYLGAVAAVGLVVATERLSSSKWWPWAAASTLCGIGVSLSGSRVAFVAAPVAVFTLMATRRDRCTAVAGGTALLSLAVGVGVDRWLGAGRNAADRLADGSGSGRFEVWGYGIRAALDKPVFGYGFGRFRPAVQGRFSTEFVRDNAANDATQAWFDAHNVFITVFVAVGLIGVLLFGAFVVSCLRSARGPLAWGLLPIAAHWLLQPVSLFTLPLAAIMLGAAMPPVTVSASQVEHVDDLDTPTDAAVDAGTSRCVNVLPKPALLRNLAILGLFLGSVVVIADGLLSRAADAKDANAAATVGDVYLGDPVVSNVVAQVYAADPSVADPLTEVIRWRERSTRTEPDRPYWWTQLAEAQIAAQRYGDAQASIDRALELQPTNVSAWLMQGLLSVRTDDREQLVEALDRLCELGQPECELDVDELLADNEG